MTIVYATLWLAGLYPFTAAWWAHRRTSLAHAIVWAIVAWVAWGWLFVIEEPPLSGMDPARYIALCLTGAAGIAVLGARRPQVIAWHFVVIGLIAVLVLPLVEGGFIGTEPADPIRMLSLGGTLAVGLINYLPTRCSAAFIVLGLALAEEMLTLVDRTLPLVDVQLADIVVLLTPWIALVSWVAMRRRVSEFDRLWRDFRDSWGYFWAQRVRDQFNRAAANAGWPVHLAWQGLHRTDRGAAIGPAEQEEMLEVLRAALGRFL